MTTSYTSSESQSFTITHAKKIAVKVATDLKRIQRFYGQPSDRTIVDYEKEIIQLLRFGYLKKISYGLKKNDQWIEPSLHFEAEDIRGGISVDDDPGHIKPGSTIYSANLHSFLIYNSNWWTLTEDERKIFERNLPFTRKKGEEPSINGYLSQDKTYSAGGKSIVRSTVKSF
ncbi:MAG: hypothetical protein OXC61_06050 [Flavobacteriaceae bacterium]|nr:hypothetical protein [Flavobacteriaceae bacterium]